MATPEVVLTGEVTVVGEDTSGVRVGGHPRPLAAEAPEDALRTAAQVGGAALVRQGDGVDEERREHRGLGGQRAVVDGFPRARYQEGPLTVTVQTIARITFTG